MQLPKSNINRSDLLSGFVAIVAIIGVASCALMTWYQLRSSTYDATVALEITQKQQAALAEQKQPTIPALKLNQDYGRQGPVVTVNPSSDGKPNPFITTP